MSRENVTGSKYALRSACMSEVRGQPSCISCAYIKVEAPYFAVVCVEVNATTQKSHPKVQKQTCSTIRRYEGSDAIFKSHTQKTIKILYIYCVFTCEKGRGARFETFTSRRTPSDSMSTHLSCALGFSRPQILFLCCGSCCSRHWLEPFQKISLWCHRSSFQHTFVSTTPTTATTTATTLIRFQRR